LLRYLGPERFWASLHLYVDRHALGNATSDDLRQAVLDATGENLDWFWSEWVYDAGHPRFVVTAAYDTTARKLTPTVKQTQTGAAYSRTRAGAVEALGELPAASTAAPLAAALHDTSAQVRRAGVAALGQLGGARAAELARATFQTDPSYEVRAAALTALVRADSTARDSAVAWGLATPSYQDVIQEAAYRIIAQTRDTAAIPRAEERLATDRLAAPAVAALAAPGSAHAREVLPAHRSD